MKKLISLLLVLAMILACPFVFASCGEPEGNGTTGTTNGGNNTTGTTGTTGITGTTGGNNNNNGGNTEVINKISGKLVAGSKFSEGLAFVQTDAAEGTTYCINKAGEIVFTLNDTLPQLWPGEIDTYFINGLACVMSENGNYLIDKTGKITRPEEFGATNFYPAALEEGYLLVGKEEVSYNGSKKELGIMTTSFEWVVEPTEELYEAVYSNELGSVSYADYSVCRAGFLCVMGIGKEPVYLDLKTGNYSNKNPQDTYVFDYTDAELEDAVRNQLGDTVSSVNVHYAPESFLVTFLVTFYNEGKIFMTIADGELNFLFEPVLVIENSYKVSSFRPVYDGEYVMLEVYDSSNKVNLVIYDKAGNLLGTFKPSSLGENVAYSYEFKDGVVWIKGSYGYTIRSMGYYNTSFELLF